MQDPAAGHFRFEGSYQKVVVVVHGDNGLTGIEETDSPPSVIRATIEMPTCNSQAMGLAEVVTGQVIDDPRRLWDQMYAATQWFGRHDAVIHAISALYIAIWDLLAKSRNIPIHALIGHDCGLMLDVAQEFTRIDQLAPFIALLEGLDFHWIEAPFPLGNPEDHITLKTCTSIPIGVGDLGFTTCAEFRPYLDLGAIDIAQPDLTMFGGISEAIRLITMLRGTGVRIAPHGYNSDITIAANLHLTATLEEESLIEFSPSPARTRRELCSGLPPVDADGMIAVPQEPGLGLTLHRALATELKRLSRSRADNAKARLKAARGNGDRSWGGRSVTSPLQQ